LQKLREQKGWDGVKTRIESLDLGEVEDAIEELLEDEWKDAMDLL
jgi:hypothetical protein